jgi:hypothetical protein
MTATHTKLWQPLHRLQPASVVFTSPFALIVKSSRATALYGVSRLTPTVHGHTRPLLSVGIMCLERLSES